MHLGTTIVETMTVVVHPMHFRQYPILGLAFGRKGEVTDDLGAGWNEFLLNVFPGLGHLRFDFGGRGRQGLLWRVQVSGSAGEYSAKLMTTHFGKPAPHLSERFEGSPCPNMSQGLDSVLDHNVEEKYSPGPIVGGIESRLEQREKVDETLRRHKVINRIHSGRR